MTVHYVYILLHTKMHLSRFKNNSTFRSRGKRNVRFIYFMS